MLIVCHYAEIALKGGNRKIFEEKLVDNIKKSFNKNGIVFKYVKRIFGRILIELSDNQENGLIVKALKSVFGIAHFSFAEKCEKDIERIARQFQEWFPKRNELKKLTIKSTPAGFSGELRARYEY